MTDQMHTLVGIGNTALPKLYLYQELAKATKKVISGISFLNWSKISKEKQVLCYVWKMQSCFCHYIFWCVHRMFNYCPPSRHKSFYHVLCWGFLNKMVTATILKTLQIFKVNSQQSENLAFTNVCIKVAHSNNMKCVHRHNNNQSKTLCCPPSPLHLLGLQVLQYTVREYLWTNITAIPLEN